MLNKYIEINRIEFLTTKRCNANCKHCSVPINSDQDGDSYNDIESVAACFRYLLDSYNISSTMAYGGEPLLCIESIVRLFEIASEYNVPTIDLITSGFVSHNTPKEQIASIVSKLSTSGVKRILLSVDAFHQERIPIENVEFFIEKVLELDFCQLLLHPAWLISEGDENLYNKKTYKILDVLRKKYSVRVSAGNRIIPSGSNKRNIGQFYEARRIKMDKCGEIPYTNPLDKIKSIRILPDGSINICRGITIGNVFNQSIEDIFENYYPGRPIISDLLYTQGVKGLYDFAVEYGIKVKPAEYFGTCDFCADCIHFLKERGVT